MELFSGVILFLSGLGAGVITGIIGASAVTFMVGILIAVLGYGAYVAIGIGLMTDVSASLVSAHMYRRAKNLDIKRGLMIGIIATIFAFMGSILSRGIPDLMLKDSIGILLLATGIVFLIKNPLEFKKGKLIQLLEKNKTLSSLLIGAIIGLIAGIFGMGGGISILILLVFLLRFPIKTAVGTSVLIMAFISLSGGIGHFLGTEFPWKAILIASIGGIIGAGISSYYANKISERKMFKITGVILILLSLTMVFKKFLLFLNYISYPLI